MRHIAIAVTLAAVCSTAACTTATEQTLPNSSTSRDAPHALEADAGTWGNPYRPGDTFDVGEWEVTLTETRLDANDELLAEDPYNEVEPGFTAVMVDVTATYTGDATGLVQSDLTFVWYGPDGSSHYRFCGTVPKSLIAREQYPGGTVTGNACTLVPDDKVASGLWLVDNRRISEAYVAAT